MVLPLPMIKLGGLIVRTLTKPLAKVVKTRSKVDPSLNAVCHSLGQTQHRLLIRFHMGYRGIPNFTVKDLPADQAVEKGADLIGELIIFSVAVAVATFEYQRSSAKSKEKERLELENKRLQEEATERRFEELESKVIWLEAQLAAVGRIVELDLDKRIQEAKGTTTVLTPPWRPRKDSDVSVASTASTDHSADASSASESGAGDAGPPSLWTATYNSVASLFR